MCLLAVLFQVTDDAPLVIAANREEFYARGGDPPRRFDDVDAIGGVDPTQGGTWLGVNAQGLVVAVTNRRKTVKGERPPSRGLLVRSLLSCRDVEEAQREATYELQRRCYDGCNLFFADSERCCVIQHGDDTEVRTLAPGIHVLSNRDVDDPHDERVQHVLQRLRRHSLTSSAEAIPVLRQICVSPEVCFRLHDRGTVSSSLLVLPRRLEDGQCLHAQGAPNVTAYVDLSHLLRELRG